MKQATFPVDAEKKRRPTISAEGAIDRHLRANKTGSRRRFTSVLQGVYRLGGADGVVRWSIARLQKDIGSKAEQEQLSSLLKSVANAERRGQAEIVREWEEANEIEELAFQERQKRNRERLHRRAANRHMNDPRIELQARLKRHAGFDSAPEPTPKKNAHSRRPKGECGQRIGKKIDVLLAEIREHEVACESSCCAAPEATTSPPSDGVDPPSSVVAVAGGGSDDTRAPVEAASSGGSAGFSNHDGASAWDVLSGQGEMLTDQAEFLKEIEQSGELRAAATLRMLTRLRTALEQLPETAGLSDPVEVPLQDCLLSCRQLMSRLR